MPEVIEQQAELPLVPSPPAVAPRRFELPPEPVAEATPAPAESVPPTKPDAQDTGDQATPAEPEGEKPEPEVTPEQAAKREGRRFERKLDKAYRERAEARARAELLEKQVAELRQPQAPPGKPTLEQFDYDPEKYATALADFEKTRFQREIEEKQRTEVGQQTQQKLLAAWEEKVGRGEDKYDDYATVVGELTPNNPFVHAVMDAENGEEVAYFLGKNPKEAQRIAGLSPISQVREIGRLEERLQAKPVEPKAPSKAPAPITPLTGAATVPGSEPSEQDDMRTWIRKREKQLGRR